MAASSLPPHVDHLIVGSGFAGLCAAIRLAEDGETDYLVIEKGDDVGGTWRDNTYPGACCDIPSQLYSFSFARNPDWSSSYSPQPEIQAVPPHGRPRVRRPGAHRVRHRARARGLGRRDPTLALPYVVRRGSSRRPSSPPPAACPRPRLPEIEGIETFDGALFHSARWDHSVDLAGKRVAVIGTGASAIQIVPEVQPIASHLDVYQRTAPWVIPRNDRTYSRLERARAAPGAGPREALPDRRSTGRHEGYVPGSPGSPGSAALPRRRRSPTSTTGSRTPTLRGPRSRPTFRLGCKRILRSNTYYPALAAANTSTSSPTPIARITPTAIVTADGVEHPVDVIVVATGFWTTDLPIARADRGPRRPHPRRGVGRRRHVGVQGHDRPRLPQPVPARRPQHRARATPAWCSSSRRRSPTCRDAVRTMRSHRLRRRRAARGRSSDTGTTGLQRRMKRTVWNTGGCSSWYLDSHGRNTTSGRRRRSPSAVSSRRFDPDAYDVQADAERDRGGARA